MTEFYTYFGREWDNVVVRGYRNGKRFIDTIPYEPKLFIRADQGDYKDIHGNTLDVIEFPSMRDAGDFMRKYSDVENFPIYGLTSYEYVYIYENYKDMKPDYNLIKVLDFDIETDSENGFGDIQLANRKIISISMKLFKDNNIYVYGYKDYTPSDPEVIKMIEKGFQIHYEKCEDERDLLIRFRDKFRELDPDILTGWNIETFDVPYIIKRMMKHDGKEFAQTLSPFNKIEHKTIMQYNNEIDTYKITGIATIDMMEAHKKFSYTKQESYSLDFTSREMLNVAKLDYSEYRSLANLYAGRIHIKDVDAPYDKENENYRWCRLREILLKKGFNKLNNGIIFDYTIDELEDIVENNGLFKGDIIDLCEEKMSFHGHCKFIDYNIIDIYRVEQINDYRGYINLVLTIAYYVKINLVDTFGTIRAWDIMIHNYLMDRKICVPQLEEVNKNHIQGGYVKDPQIGRHSDAMVFDFTSLYPMIDIMCNISPETLMGRIPNFESDTAVERVLGGYFGNFRDKMVERNICVTGRGNVFTRDFKGFLPSIMNDLFVERKKFTAQEEADDDVLASIRAEMHKRGMEIKD